jgi:hypothetical protein
MITEDTGLLLMALIDIRNGWIWETDLGISTGQISGKPTVEPLQIRIAWKKYPLRSTRSF